MNRWRIWALLVAVLATLLGGRLLMNSVQPEVFIQSDISAAKIVRDTKRYVVDIAMLATDVERMFLMEASERVGEDLSKSGALEREIGKFVGNRVTMRDDSGAVCASTVARAGEDPANDEGVLVVLSFECASDNATYDATRLLTTQGPRAWQVVTTMRGEMKRQVLVNWESPPVAMSDAH